MIAIKNKITYYSNEHTKQDKLDILPFSLYNEMVKEGCVCQPLPVSPDFSGQAATCRATPSVAPFSRSAMRRAHKYQIWVEVSDAVSITVVERDCIHNTPFYSQLTNAPNKLVSHYTGLYWLATLLYWAHA
jgi:hypothetical protein